MVDTLSLVRRLRPHEQSGQGVSRSECSFLDFKIDGVSLLDSVARRTGLISTRLFTIEGVVAA